MFRQAKTILKEVLAVPDRWTYRDLAITPQDETEFDNLDLYHATDGGADALARKRRVLRGNQDENSYCRIRECSPAG